MKSLTKGLHSDGFYDFTKTASTWKHAIHQARSQQGNFSTIQRFYQHTANDLHLASQINRQIESVNSSKFKFTDQSGEEVQVGNWIYDFLREFQLSKFFGFSVLEIQKDREGGIKMISVPRTHIDPIKKIFYPKIYGHKQIKYESWKNILDIPYHNIYGDFEKITPLVLMKYYTLSALSTYNDRFAMPTRVVKTDTTIEGREAELHKAAQDMAQMGTIVLNNDEFLEFVQANQGNNDLFLDFVKYIDHSLSKVVNGSITGEVTSHGSKAREQVSNDINEVFNESTKQRITPFINNTVLPKLGLDLKFEFIIEQDKDKLFDKVTRLPNYDFDIDWMNETFGLKIISKNGNSEQAG